MPPILSVKDVGVVLDGKSIVEAISFELAAGDSLAIIGPNGSGKTVLLRALLGIVSHSGAVAWAPGVKVGYVPQKIEADRQLPLSIGDLLRAKARVVHLPSDKVQSVADVIGLTPEILEKPIGRLSGGQSQKALIAFALLGDPNVLLLDEPTASLDQLTEERVYELIRRLQKTFGLTLIIVSHDLSMVYREATKVLCVNRQGMCFGPPSSVLTPETLQALYGEHLHFYQHPHNP